MHCRYKIQTVFNIIYFILLHSVNNALSLDCRRQFSAQMDASRMTKRCFVCSPTKRTQRMSNVPLSRKAYVVCYTK
uniref:Putative secreted protein n=1 Tax=Anopheles darlingi TaxID=43151 RepID=A0A2M4D628_ANODA